MRIMIRTQIMLSPSTLDRINEVRGDVPLSIFLRKRIEKEFEGGCSGGL